MGAPGVSLAAPLTYSICKKLLHGIPFFLPDSSALKTPTQLNALAHIKEALPPEIYTTPQILPRTPYNAKKCRPATEAPLGRFDF